MADHKSKADFNAMSVVELKKYLQERRISASGYLKTSLVEITSAITSSARGSKFRKGDTTVLDELIIHSMLIPNPFFLKAVNNFNASQPFGFYDILIIWFALLNSSLALRSDLKGLWLLLVPLSNLPVWRSSVRRVLAKANFLASLFVCFSFARCLPFTIESRHLGMVYIFIPKTKQWYKRMTELTYPFFTSNRRYGIRIHFCWTIFTDKM